MPRLFTGLEIPPSVVQSLSMMRGGLPGRALDDPENYHLTLRFIGDIDDALAHEIAGVLGRIHRGAFELRLDGLTSFGGRKPRALVASVAPIAPLMELQAEHERLLQRLGLEPEGRKYTPHVTLARLRDTSSWEVADYLGARGHYRSCAVSGPAICIVLVALVGRRRPLYRRGLLSARRAGAQVGLIIRVCKSSIAVAKPWLSAIISRISDNAVGRDDSTSPTTLPKSNESSASNLRASCCMRWFSARQAICNNRKLRLRAASNM
jgi:2'-5' RNA ligase